jgi:hypothetical protein
VQFDALVTSPYSPRPGIHASMSNLRYAGPAKITEAVSITRYGIPSALEDLFLNPQDLQMQRIRLFHIRSGIPEHLDFGELMDAVDTRESLGRLHPPRYRKQCDNPAYFNGSTDCSSVWSF